MELREAQLESLRTQAQRDNSEIRELKSLLDEARLETESLRKDRERR